MNYTATAHLTLKIVLIYAKLAAVIVMVDKGAAKFIYGGF
jgi:hypothetical protein